MGFRVLQEAWKASENLVYLPKSAAARHEVAPMQPVAFEGYTFDPGRGALTGPDGAEIPLRPKTHALLAHLLARRGHLVPREELLETVWPGVYVSDDSITQCVSEIRRALGEQGPRLLRTVPKRGYLLDFEAGEETLAARPAPAGATAVQNADAILPRPPLGRVQGWWPMLRLPVLVFSAALLAAAAADWLWRPSPPTPPAGPQHVQRPGAPDRPARREAERLHQEGRRLFDRASAATGGWLPARDLFEQAIAADPEYAPPYAFAVFTYANSVLNRQSLDPASDLSRAMALAAEAMRLDPNLPETHAARAAVLRLNRNYEDALIAYRRTVAIDPTQWPSAANAGYMLILLGRPAEALAPIRRVLAERPTHGFAEIWQTYLGLALMASGQEDFGAEAFRSSLARPTANVLDYAERQLHLAAALALSGSWDAARSLAAAVRVDRPDLTVRRFRERPLSDHPEFLRQRENFYRGLILAGVPAE